MTNKNTIKQNLANLKAELADRQGKATAAQQAEAELTQQISQLQGAMALDGVDHTERINQAKAELAAANSVLATWPDVEAELRRRIGDAEQALAQESQAANLQRWEVVSALEAEQRKEFAQAVVALADVAQRLRLTIDERQALYLAVFNHINLPGGRPSNYLPEFRADWVHFGKMADAKAALRELLD